MKVKTHRISIIKEVKLYFVIVRCEHVKGKGRKEEKKEGRVDGRKGGRKEMEVNVEEETNERKEEERKGVRETGGKRQKEVEREEGKN